MPHAAFFIIILVYLLPTQSALSEKPVRAVMVTGGCCHDYLTQERLISEALSGISLGHHNATIATDQWRSIVVDGWKWALE